MSKSNNKQINSIQNVYRTIILPEIDTSLNIKTTLIYSEYKNIVQESVESCFLYSLDGSEEYHPEYLEVSIAKAILNNLGSEETKLSDDLLWLLCSNRDYKSVISYINDTYQLYSDIRSSINFRIQNIVARQSAKLDEIIHQITEYMKVYNSVGEQLKDFNAKEAMGYLKKMTGYSEGKIADNILSRIK